MVISIIAISISILSLVINLFQWVSRHRPYLAVVDIKWFTISEEHVFKNNAYPDSVKCTIKNVGEAPAQEIIIHGSTKTFAYNFPSIEKKTDSPLGLLFPGQNMEVILPFDVDSPNIASVILSLEGIVDIDSLISYKGIPLFRQWSTKYETQQKFVMDQNTDSWQAIAGCSYK
jgi:hypothetical protein